MAPQPYSSAMEGAAAKGEGTTKMPDDDLKAFRIRQSPKGGRKPAPGPDIEANILDAAEFVFGHSAFEARRRLCSPRKRRSPSRISTIISRTRKTFTEPFSSAP